VGSDAADAGAGKGVGPPFIMIGCVTRWSLVDDGDAAGYGTPLTEIATSCSPAQRESAWESGVGPPL
jgi:hypothetical protein